MPFLTNDAGLAHLIEAIVPPSSVSPTHAAATPSTAAPQGQGPPPTSASSGSTSQPQPTPTPTPVLSLRYHYGHDEEADDSAALQQSGSGVLRPFQPQPLPPPSMPAPSTRKAPLMPASQQLAPASGEAAAVEAAPDPPAGGV